MREKNKITKLTSPFGFVMHILKYIHIFYLVRADSLFVFSSKYWGRKFCWEDHFVHLENWISYNCVCGLHSH